MNLQDLMPVLFAFTWKHLVMLGVGGILIYLAIKKEYEPTLLLPMGFGAILVNIPLSSAITQFDPALGEEVTGALSFSLMWV